MSRVDQRGAAAPLAAAFEAPGLGAGWWTAFRRRLRLARQVLALMDEVRRERRAMAALSYRDFGDMGIDQGTALAESERSMFDLPADRLREALR